MRSLKRIVLHLCRAAEVFVEDTVVRAVAGVRPIILLIHVGDNVERVVSIICSNNNEEHNR